MEEIRKAYNKLIKNRFYRDEMRPYLLTEVREYALQISMRRLDLWDKFCQVESNVKQALPVAKEAGFDNVLSYYLARDEEYVHAEAVINLIDNGNVDEEPQDSNAKLALIAFYKGESIPRGNNGKLYQKFVHYKKDFNRIGATDSPPEIRFRVALLRSVIEELSGDAKAKAWAEKDLREFEDNITNSIYFEKDFRSILKKGV